MGKYETQRLFLTSFGFNMIEIKCLVSKIQPDSCFVVILDTWLLIQSPAAFAILIILCLFTARIRVRPAEHTTCSCSGLEVSVTLFTI